jgi:hypothetical protein
MEFPTDLYDPKTLDLMQWAFDTAWEEVEYALAGSQMTPRDCELSCL